MYDLFNSSTDIDPRINLISPISLHTYSLSAPIPLLSFKFAYEYARYHVYGSDCKKSIRSKYSIDDFPPFNKMINDVKSSNSTYTNGRTFKPIYIADGLYLRLSIHDNMSRATYLVNPWSLYINDQNISSSNYMIISPRDFEFWRDSYNILMNKTKNLELGNYFAEKWSFPRLDFSATFALPLEFDIPLFLNYQRRILKCHSFHDEDFKYAGMSEHMVKFYNSLQSFIIYDKGYEQHYRYHNDEYDPYSYLRMEYSTTWQKLKQVIAKYHDKGLIPKRSNNPMSELYFLSNISPIVMYDMIGRIFPDGDILTRKKFLKAINKLSCFDTTKDRAETIVSSLSKSNSYDDTIRISKELKEKYGENQFRHTMSVLENNKISPIYLKRSDEKYVSSLPSVKKIFMSGISSSLNETNHFNKMYSEGLDYIKPNEAFVDEIIKDLFGLN